MSSKAKRKRDSYDARQRRRVHQQVASGCRHCIGGMCCYGGIGAFGYDLPRCEPDGCPLEKESER